jgi:hypothetical protein
MNQITTTHSIRSEVDSNYYSIITGKEILIPTRLKDEQYRFGKTWEDLKKDNYLKNEKSFRYRRFRYLYFSPTSGKITPFAHTPYFQPSEINQYAEGIDRKLDAIEEESLSNTFLQELIKFDFLQLPIKEQKKSDSWLVDIHQLRIITTEAESGEPTPEGVHHDENDFVCIHLIERKNITGGVNGIYNNNRELLKNATLTNHLDSIILWDPKVMHGVTPIHPKVSKNIAFRDVLLICFSHAPNLPFPTGNTISDYKIIKENINPPVLLNEMN